jgi:hypothetical protein
MSQIFGRSEPDWRRRRGALHEILCRRWNSIHRFERVSRSAGYSRAFFTHSFESLKNGLERLRKLHQPHIVKFCANQQMN